MKRDYEKEAKALLKKFRPLRSKFLKLIANGNKVASNVELRECADIIRRLWSLDPLTIMFYGDTVPFRDSVLPENKQKEKRVKREKNLIRKIVSALKSGKMQPPR